MLKRKVWITILTMILALAVASGCGNADKRTSSEIMQDALIKSGEVKSSTFEGQFQLNLELSDEVKNGLSEDELMGLNMLQNAKISYKGSTQADPLQSEITLSTDLPIGDLQTHLEVPMLLTEKKMWIKVPNLPGVGEYAGKFVELDFEKLSELSGEPVAPVIDPAKQQQLNKDVVSLLFKHLDHSYFSKVDVKSLDLPDNVKVENAIEFKVTQEQFGPLLTVFVDKILPEFFDLMAKPEYKDIFGIPTEEIEEAKKAVSNSKSDIDDFVTELNNNASNTLLTLTTAIDKDGFSRQNLFKLSTEIKNPDGEGTIKIDLNAVHNTTTVNQSVSFENTFPPAEDQVVPFETLMMGLSGMTGDLSLDEGADAYQFTDEEIDVWNEMATQPWFINNAEAISNKLTTDEDFVNELNDPELVRALIDDADFRQEFFGKYGIEIVE